ncbi:MAG: response regulator [Candidatus Omnitrophota bacterium]
MSKAIRLLLVDDETKFLHTLAKRLEMRGFEVHQAENGRLAIEAARQNRFDLALLDLKMSGMWGDEVLKILKKEQKDLEIVILTGHGSQGFAEECARLGAFRYLPKPFELEELLLVFKDAYKTRLKKKYALDSHRIERIEQLDDSSPPMDILQSLHEIESHDEA